MSAFDFFFPEQAQASHLRSMVKQKEREYYLEQRETKDIKDELQDTRKSVKKLSCDLARATLVVMALSELLEEAGICTKEKLAEKIKEIDLLDGVEDGELDGLENGQFVSSKPKFEAKKSWKDLQ